MTAQQGAADRKEYIMKRITAILLTLALLLLCTGCAGGAKELTLSDKRDADSLEALFVQDGKFGLSGLEWGISRSEAEKTLGFTFEDVALPEETEGITFAAHPARFLGLSGTMRLAFSDDRLYTVQLIVDKGDLTKQFDALREDLFTAFGETENRYNMDEDPDAVMYIWRREPTLLGLYFFPESGQITLIIGTTKIE